MNSYCVIGLGRFGMNVAKELIRLGHEVMVIDRDKNVLRQVTDMATYAIEADVLNEHALKEAGIGNCDCVIVGTAEEPQAAIMATMIAKEMGVPMVVAKASSDLHARVLKRVGADKIIFPEKESGTRLAHLVGNRGIVDFIPLEEDISIVELVPPESWLNKKLKELDLRNKFHISVIAIKNDTHINAVPTADSKIKAGNTLIVIGESKDIERIQ
ncbi:MAG: TrkA family potassium uptake protein [Tissierellia bacterium]|nr:TrkA family potassium uptake protein [Tissierellia bacterium]